MEIVPQLLIESPNPDSVLVLLVRLLESTPRDFARLVGSQSSLLHYASLVFGHSPWLGETLIRNPDLLKTLTKEVGQSHSVNDFREKFARWRAASPNAELSISLARFRKREYVRILLRELLGIAKLAETTTEISALADALVEEAVIATNVHLRQRYGTPCWEDNGRLRESSFSIVSLGKLGGEELNYSSDIDLLFLYDGGVEPQDAALSNREYFILLAQQTTELLSRHTLEGQVFRIDLRLRPQGHEGELAVSLPTAIRYYSEVAEDWELQAMIKARHTAGDPGLTQEFMRALAPYVYRPNINFAAVKTALQSRERIDKKGIKLVSGRPAQKTVDVKLDRGGIRDIEFLLQCLQRVYGGEEGWLRSRGTLFALQKLHDKEHISGKDFHHLTKAYEFLRHVEHHLQLRQGQQTHQLPKNSHELKVLAKSVRRAERARQDPEDFVLLVESRMASVAEIYRRIVYQEQSQQFIDEDGNLRLQTQVPPSVENSYTQILQRIAVDSPQLLALITGSELSQHGRRNLDRFLSSAATGSERYSAVLRSKEAIGHALRVFDRSEYLTDILVRHPGEVDLLRSVCAQRDADSAELFSIPEPSATDVPDPLLAYLANGGVDRLEAMALFRQQFRSAVFMANAADLFDRRNIFETLDQNSAIADRALAYATATAGAPAGFAVMVLGRLGTREFDVLSDADVLFVADESTDPQEARRAAERIVEFLTAYTRDGNVFPVDTRLRPQGREGELVTTSAHLERYFESVAQPWEAITYLRLRFATGDRSVAQEALEKVNTGISCVAQRQKFVRELREMRRRLESSDPAPNWKTGPGGTYDIDFLCGELQAQQRLWSHGNLVQRVESLRGHGLIENADAEIFIRSARFLRTIEHYARLVTGRTATWLPLSEHAQASMTELVALPEGTLVGGSLLETVQEVCRNTRDICRKYLFD